MENKEIGVCPICGTEFVKTCHNKQCCTRRCSGIYSKMKIKARGTACPHNEGLICTNRNCESCGWNPVVAQRRSECHGKG